MWSIPPDLHSLVFIGLLFSEDNDLEGLHMSCAQVSAWHKGGFRSDISHVSQAQPIKPIKIGLINSHCGHTGRSVADNDLRQEVYKYLLKNPQNLRLGTHIPKALGKSPNF